LEYFPFRIVGETREDRDLVSPGYKPIDEVIDPEVLRPEILTDD
jgi:hypothetical protein